MTTSLMRYAILAGLLLGVATFGATRLVAQEAESEPDPPAGQAAAAEYAEHTVEGWTLVVHRDVIRDIEHWQLVRGELASQLFQVARRMPAAALAHLRAIRIWVERSTDHCTCACYHPNETWLRDNGVNPDKHRCVEIGNTTHFIEWSVQQPAMVLHELAHGYHHRVLKDGFENQKLRQQFEQMTESGSYDEVLHASGARQPAYALNNSMEYFAESSEAFFLTNDHYPFVRAELAIHDPAMTALLTELWLGKPDDSE